MAVELTAQLEDAIARGSAAVLSLPSDGMFRDYRTRFLGDSPHGLWMDGVVGEAPLIEQLIRSAELCPVTFSALGSAVQFKSRLILEDSSHVLNSGVKVLALLLERPDHVAALQRRANYRVKIQPDTELVISAWRISDGAKLDDTPGPGTQLKLSVVDLSTTGLGAAMQVGPRSHALAANQRLRVLLRWRKQPEVLLEARAVSVRPKPDPSSVIVGMRFEGLQSAMDGRRIEAMLNRIMGELSRAEIRQLRRQADDVAPTARA